MLDYLLIFIATGSDKLHTCYYEIVCTKVVVTFDLAGVPWCSLFGGGDEEPIDGKNTVRGQEYIARLVLGTASCRAVQTCVRT